MSAEIRCTTSNPLDGPFYNKGNPQSEMVRNELLQLRHQSPRSYKTRPTIMRPCSWSSSEYDLARLASMPPKFQGGRRRWKLKKSRCVVLDWKLYDLLFIDAKILRL